jgi:FAD synthase
VRSEKKFKNKEELKLQLIKDKEYCKSLQILKGEVNDNK